MNEDILKFFNQSKDEAYIDNNLYHKYNVKNGLRNEDGTGVLVGLTRISDVIGYEKNDGKKKDIEGKLYYRGIDVEEIIDKHKSKRYLFEEVCFLILFGHLPNKKELEKFKLEIRKRYELPAGYLKNSILGSPSQNMMNKLQQEILKLYSYDEDADNTDPEALLDKGLNLIAKIPAIACYCYQSKVHYFDKGSLIIHQIRPDYSIAENILYLLRDHGSFSQKEAQILDMCLVLHADHGGSNNSTFTNIVISSTGTDIYSSIAGAVGSLKGPKHGGANLAVMNQMETVINELGLEASDEEITRIIDRILNKDFNDKSGLIYGIGHAVYTLSDPRCRILRQKCEELAIQKGREAEFDFFSRFEKIAIKRMKEKKNINVCANVDFYTGLIYDMLAISKDLYTLIFVIGRSVGWVAHNIENNLYSGRIIRPASKYVGEYIDYTEMEDR